MGLRLVLLGFYLVCVDSSTDYSREYPDAELIELFECDEDGFMCRKRTTAAEAVRRIGWMSSALFEWQDRLRQYVQLGNLPCEVPDGYAVLVMGLSCLLAAVLMYSWQNTWRQAGIPGPSSYTLFGNSIHIQLRGGLRHSVQQWREEYGKVFGIHLGTQPVLVVSDVTMVGEILQNRLGCFTDKPTPPPCMRNGPLRHSLFNIQGREWEALRHVLSIAFSPNSLKYMICRLNRCSQNLAEYVEDEAIASREIEIEGFLKSYVYDSSVAVLCGLDLDHQDDSSHEFFRVVSDALKSFVTEYGGMCVPGRRQVDDLVNYFNGTIEERRIHYRDAWVQGLQGRLCDLVQYFKHSLIHRGPNRTWQPGRLDLIGILLQAGRPQMVNPISTPADALDDDCIVGALLTWVLHGNQTLLSTLQFVVHMLAQNQRQQELCCREIDDILGTDDPHEDALLEMTHLEKFIRETLRILPPVQEVWRSAKATCVVQGVTIPKGASVLIPVNLLHDDEQNFVHPFLFRPERFYGSDAVRGLKTAGLNLAFGGGSRMCLGMWITVLQVKIAIIYLLRRVTFMPVQPDPGALESDNFELQAGLPVTDEGLLRPVRPFKVIAIPRHPRAVYSHPRINQPMPIRNPSRSTDVTDLENEMLDKAEDGPLHQAFKTQKATSLWGVNYPSSRMSWGGSSRSSYPDSSSSESSASSRSFSPSFSFQAGKQTLFTSKKSGHAAESDPWKTASWNSLGSQGTSSGSSKRNEGVSSESKLGQPDRDIVADVEDAVTDLFGPSHFSVGRDETLVYGGEYVILTPSYKSFRPTGENDKKTQGMSGGTRARGTHVTWSGKPDDAPSDCRLILSSIIDTVAMSCDQSEAEFDLSTARAYMDSALNVDLDGLEDRLLRKKLKLESAAHRIVQAALDDAKDTDSEGYLAAARKNTSENRQIPRRDDSFGCQTPCMSSGVGWDELQSDVATSSGEESAREGPRPGPSGHQSDSSRDERCSPRTLPAQDPSLYAASTSSYGMPGVAASVLRSIPDTISPRLRSVSDAVSPRLRSVSDAVSPRLRSVSDAVSPRLRSISDAVSPRLRYIPDAVLPTLSSIPDTVSPTLRYIPEVISPSLRSIPDAFSPTVWSIPDAVSPALKSIPDALSPSLRHIPDAIAPTLRHLPDAIAPTLRHLPDAIAPTLRHLPYVISPSTRLLLADSSTSGATTNTNQPSTSQGSPTYGRAPGGSGRAEQTVGSPLEFSDSGEVITISKHLKIIKGSSGSETSSQSSRQGSFEIPTGNRNPAQDGPPDGPAEEESRRIGERSGRGARDMTGDDSISPSTLLLMDEHSDSAAPGTSTSQFQTDRTDSDPAGVHRQVLSPSDQESCAGSDDTDSLFGVIYQEACANVTPLFRQPSPPPPRRQLSIPSISLTRVVPDEKELHVVLYDHFSDADNDEPLCRESEERGSIAAGREKRARKRSGKAERKRKTSARRKESAGLTVKGRKKTSCQDDFDVGSDTPGRATPMQFLPEDRKPTSQVDDKTTVRFTVSPVDESSLSDGSRSEISDVSITGPNQPSTSMKLVSTAKDDVTVTAADQPMISKTATNSEEKSSGKVDASVAEARQSLSSERVEPSEPRPGHELTLKTSSEVKDALAKLATSPSSQSVNRLNKVKSGVKIVPSCPSRQRLSNASASRQSLESLHRSISQAFANIDVSNSEPRHSEITLRLQRQKGSGTMEAAESVREVSADGRTVIRRRIVDDRIYK